MRATSSLVLAGIMVLSAFTTPVVAVQGQQESNTTQNEQLDDEYGAIAERLQDLARRDIGAETDLSDQHEDAATEGAREGAQLAQEQGADVTQEQQQAAIDGAVSAAAQSQEASVEQIQAAAKGAAHGALLQSQDANITQLQSGVYGSTAGALTQSQDASVTQLQSAGYGAAHGTSLSISAPT